MLQKKLIIYICLLPALLGLQTRMTVGQEPKPRVIAMTDGEIDDRSSMIRFLLYTNDIDLQAIIQTNSVYQRGGWSSEKWIEKQIDAYEKVYPNLLIHDPSYPSAAELRSKLYVGDEDSTHIMVDQMSARRLPGMDPVIDPAGWPDTPGSDRIVEVLLQRDPRPVYIQAWGGGNTAARAFYKLKTKYPDDYHRAISKVVMYNIWYQDGAGSYIERYHPEVTMVISYNFSGTWDYGSQRYTYQFVNDYLHNDHGPLGELYPQDYISEGDSPSFLYSVANGLRSSEDPTYGGWGGRFYKVYGNVYRDVDKGSYLRWIEYANRDFEARLDYCVADKYEEANHKPVIKLKGASDITVMSGEKVELDAEVSDPDPINLADAWRKYKTVLEKGGIDSTKFIALSANFPRYTASWWQYSEADTYDGFIATTSDPLTSKISFVAPAVDKPCTIHMILEVKDQGSPPLTAFKRVIITVLPEDE